MECHQSWRFVGRHFQLYNTSPRIPNWPWEWPCWNCATSYKFCVSVKKLGEGWTGGGSDIVKAKSAGKDPRATGDLVSNFPHPWVNKTKQNTWATLWWLLGSKLWHDNDVWARSLCQGQRILQKFPQNLGRCGEFAVYGSRRPITLKPGSSPPERPGLDNLMGQPWSDVTCSRTITSRTSFYLF